MHLTATAPKIVVYIQQTLKQTPQFRHRPMLCSPKKTCILAMWCATIPSLDNTADKRNFYGVCSLFRLPLVENSYTTT